MNADFTRQRRNLIAFSVALTILYVLDVHVTTINLLGNSLDLKNPRAVYSLLWMTWAYFLYRYFVHARELVPPSYGSRLQNRILKLLALAGEPRILEELRRSGQFEEAFSAQVTELRGMNLQGLGNSGMRYHYTFGGRLAWLDREGVWSETEIKRGVMLPLRTSVSIRFRSEVAELFLTPHFSEFYLPYLIASAPVIAAWYRWLT